MTLALYAHPFSSYCQKVLVALYENDTPFEMRQLDQEDPATFAAFEALWPLKRFPLLVDGDRPVFESTIIIEYLGLHHPGPTTLIPKGPAAALETRFLDRFFDNYVQTPLQKIVFDSMRSEGQHDVPGVADAKSMLDTAYAWLDRHMTGREWAASDGFSLADCAAAPALFYADWTHPIGDGFPHLKAYRSRLNARPSFARAIEELVPIARSSRSARPTAIERPKRLAMSDPIAIVRRCFRAYVDDDRAAIEHEAAPGGFVDRES